MLLLHDSSNYYYAKGHAIMQIVYAQCSFFSSVIAGSGVVEEATVCASRSPRSCSFVLVTSEETLSDFGLSESAGAARLTLDANVYSLIVNAKYYDAPI
jgi:hypothetical protein